VPTNLYQKVSKNRPPKYLAAPHRPWHHQHP